MHGVPVDAAALVHMRRAIEALATGTGSIQERLQAAEPHFGPVFDDDRQRTRAERHLEVRIGSGLVEGGEDDDDRDVAEAIVLLDDRRAVEIASDVVRLYELIAGLRDDDGYGTVV
jgi:hypothetical protein